MSDRGYKRSWKNLLINKRYQLRFTLFMVGISAVLMALLGWWVMAVADEATQVGRTRILGDVCPPVPALMDANGSDDEPTPAPAPPAADEPRVPGDEGTPRSRVVIDESSMTLTPVVPPDFVARVITHQQCVLER